MKKMIVVSDSGMDIQANIAKGGTLYVKGLKMEACADVLMDRLVEKAEAKIPKSFKCEYSLPWKIAGKFRGIGMDCKCTMADFEKVVGWGVKLVRLTGFRPQAMKISASVDAFQKKYGARFFVSEFAVFRRMPGATQWLSDACDLFEKRADMWSFKAYDDYHGWDLEYLEDAPYKDAQKLLDGQESARLKLMKKRWTGEAK